MLTIEKLACFVFLGVMSVFDLKFKRLPDSYLCLGVLSAVLIRIMFKGLPLRSYMMAALVGIIFIMISYFTNEKIGYGDGVIILYTGILSGLENMLFIIFTAFILCALTGIILMVIKNTKKDLSLPFVPFIFAGFIIFAGF